MIAFESDHDVLQGYQILWSIMQQRGRQAFVRSDKARWACQPRCGDGMLRSEWCYRVMVQVNAAPMVTASDGSQHRPLFMLDLHMARCEEQCDTWAQFAELCDEAISSAMDELKRQCDAERAGFN